MPSSWKWRQRKPSRSLIINSTIVQTALQKLNAARTVTQRWQDYLDYLANGNATAAQQVMRDLANNNNLYSVLPRSEFLSRAHPAPTPVPAEPDLTQQKMETLADVRALIVQYRSHRSSRGRGEADAYLAPLVALDNAARDLERGDANPMLRLAATYTSYYGQPSEPYVKLVEKFTLQALALHFNASAELQPKVDESLRLYTQRIATSAKQAKDWPLLIRALDIMAGILSARFPPEDWIQRDRTSMGYYMAGLAHEKAGDGSQALENYRKALSFQGRYLPVDEIAERMKVLRKP